MEKINYKLIILGNPILVSDEEIKGGDFYFKDGKVLQWVKGTSVTYTHVHPSNYPKPIIAGIEGLPKLDLSLIADEIGWVDVEKLAIESIKKGWGQLFMRDDKGNPYGKFIGERPYPIKFWHDIDKWVEGFKAAQSLNEKKYSEEQMIEFAHFCRDYFTHLLTINEKFNLWLSNRKPKEYLVEVEMEHCENCGGDGIYIDNDSNRVSCEVYAIHTESTPKITNNTIKVTKILK